MAKKNAQQLLLMTTKPKLKKLETDDNYLVILNKSNSKVVEKLIKEDSKYKFNQTKQDSLTIWEQKNKSLDLNDCETIAKAIAKENSTRTSNPNIRFFAEFMTDPNNRFFERLKDGEIELVDKMVYWVYVKNGKKRRDRSLGSKICKYLNEWFYKGTAYSISDSFVRKVLPYYLKKESIQINLGKKKNFDSINYSEFMHYICLLEEKISSINKHEIDHILWYCYKNDPIRLELVAALGKQKKI